MNLPWIDIETTGLDAEEDAILEIGVVITNEKLEKIAFKDWVIKPSRPQAITEISPYVMEMHQKSGLWLESLSSERELEGIELEVAGFILKHCERAPACGSSVHFDRRFLKAQAPEIDQAFHYRNIDVSTLKNLCAIYCPEANETAPEPRGHHRAMDDLYDSIELLRHYLKALGIAEFA